jgi:hypothetical protein
MSEINFNTTLENFGNNNLVFNTLSPDPSPEKNRERGII